MSAVAAGPVPVYVEVGTKLAFAGAVEWPGWCRPGRDQSAAILALVNYGARYAAVLHAGAIAFVPPAGASDLILVETIPGDASTEFGAPGGAPAADARPLDEDARSRLTALLRACWIAFDAAVAAAAGHELAKGPRGGGRDLEAIVRHVVDAEGGYLSRLGVKAPGAAALEPVERLALTRAAILETLAAAPASAGPGVGPRGGVRWSARYFVRRDAWHVLDHCWEIEDRIIQA
jgi:hypothetical protein